MSDLPAPHVQTLPASSGFEPQTWKEAVELATALSKSSIIPRALTGKPQDILVILMNGRELGLGPMQSLRQIYVVDGKPSLSASLKVGLVLKSRVCEYFSLKESTNEVATYETKRVGALGPTTMSFTIADAKKAGVAGKQNWQNYPAAMLRSRCSSALAEAVYPDVVGNLYDPEELGFDPPQEAAPKARGRAKAALPEQVDPVVDQEPPSPAEEKPEPPPKPAAAVEVLTPHEPASEVGKLVDEIVEEQAHEAAAPRSNAREAPGAKQAEEPTSWRGLSLKQWQALGEDDRAAAGDISRKQCKAILDLAKVQGVADHALVVKALRADFEREFDEWGVVELWQLNSKIASFAIDTLRGA